MSTCLYIIRTFANKLDVTFIWNIAGLQLLTLLLNTMIEILMIL
jgi:hypothetical protein